MLIKIRSRYIQLSYLEREPHFQRGSYNVIDADGFRSSVGIILANHQNRLFWAKRIGQDAWQFPQGGINPDEDFEDALHRELYEEIGLHAADVKILGATSGWLSYRLPKKMIRHYSHPLCIGQKQKWFLLRLLSSDEKIHLEKSQKPEFDRWRWVSYWYPLQHVIPFKRHVYRRALQELAPLLFAKDKERVKHSRKK